MIYTANNCLGASVYDLDTRKRIDFAMSVDTVNMEVVCAVNPVVLNKSGTEVEKYCLKFKSVYPIFGGHNRPVMFHCHSQEAIT